MLTIEKIAKRFGSGRKAVRAVTDVSFTAPDGAITTLLGANGSGKSTTLRIAVGLMAPDTGRALVDGIDVAVDPLAARSRLGVFPDRFGLYPRLTAREHIAYFGKLHGLRGADLSRAIDAAADLLDMKHILDRRTEGFSTGQSMKVALARTIVHGPKNLILDEPSRGLDIMGIRLLRGVLQRLKDDGTCILFSSHVMADVELLSDKVVVIGGGRVAAEGTVSEIKKEAGTDDLEEAFVRLVGRLDGDSTKGEAA